jgi:hypothetical protein
LTLASHVTLCNITFWVHSENRSKGGYTSNSLISLPQEDKHAPITLVQNVPVQHMYSPQNIFLEYILDGDIRECVTIRSSECIDWNILSDRSAFVLPKGSDRKE